MATSKYAKVMYESGQTFHDFAVAVDSGDHTLFTITGVPIFSSKSGFEAVIRPNGIETGNNLLTVHATDDTINIAGFTAFSKGTRFTVSAAVDTITRPASAVSKVCSVTMTDAGAIVVVAGIDGTTIAFDETRGVAGGPPYIPADSIEIGQVRMTDDTAAPLTTSELLQIPGTHTERFDLPTWKSPINTIGDGDSAASPAQKNAYVEFDAAIPTIHTADAIKLVYISSYAPLLAEVGKAYDFVPAENTHTLSSQQYYNGSIGSTASALGQASFTALMTDNITDALVGLKDEILTFKFFSDRNRAPYVLQQGIMGMGRTFPADGQNEAAITISAENASADFAS